MAKFIKKAQTGKNVPKGMVESEMFPGKMIPKSKSNYENSNYDKMLGGRSSAPKPKGLNFDKKSFDKLPTLKSKVIKKPKAQGGLLLKAVGRSLERSIPKRAMQTAENIAKSTATKNAENAGWAASRKVERFNSGTIKSKPLKSVYNSADKYAKNQASKKSSSSELVKRDFPDAPKQKKSSIYDREESLESKKTPSEKKYSEKFKSKAFSNLRIRAPRRAQNGVASVMTPGLGFAPELRQGQKDRISKIIKKDSYARANKVATRMTNRASKKSLSPNFGRFSSEIRKNGGKTMLKRADGSTSQRGLWDNIRAAKGSGKKPTAQMLKQEKKIKAKTKK